MRPHLPAPPFYPLARPPDFAVAAGMLPAVEPGVPPGGKTHPGLGRLK